jgi:hypothetical protein
MRNRSTENRRAASTERSGALRCSPRDPLRGHVRAAGGTASDDARWFVLVEDLQDFGASVGQRTKLEQDLDNDERANTRDRLAQLTSSYQEIETMPTWPLDRALRRRITLTNAALIIPLDSQIAALAGHS